MKIELPEKLYYSIGEVAKAFDVNASLIRFWEKEFPQIQPKKNKKGNRFFTPQDIQNFKLIYHLVKERGYTLEGARTALDENKNLKNEVQLVFRLEKIKEELLLLKSSLNDFESE
ncbi:HTH-type transcriptional repressor YcgE [Candidatus Ornithobacterium hominis]|uniref:MerR family transcriptional regulator n=1 Tax=Candidatus Ornithobacterium hominis TaxID=2497989 RepID=UPI000E5BEDDC|nr:MerR family transcriptional regulator [Candidatus Ornithobacterium hominis]SZD73065.1 HTH-type transcriptional repressor YcgE [Candidatus Ornithobacterium hominis]